MSHSQTARPVFQLHKEYSVLVRRFESHDVLLANMYRRSSRVLQVHDASESKSIGNVS